MHASEVKKGTVEWVEESLMADVWQKGTNNTYKAVVRPIMLYWL